MPCTRRSCNSVRPASGGMLAELAFPVQAVMPLLVNRCSTLNCAVASA